ncbi:MAG: UdgX family uracil-DNA binding protein [Vitreoscilla sp.]
MAALAIRLDSVVDWDGYARAVRWLRAEGVAPECVRWRIDGEDADLTEDLFDASEERRASALASGSAMCLPRSFVEAAREVFLHADPGRLSLIHRLASRIADDAQAWADPLHEDRLQFERLRREVQREIHKMHAFVRFRRLEATEAASADEAMSDSGAREGAAGEPPVRHVAWFEPGHHVLEAAAPFFARRFATMRWAILTPRASVEWDGRVLSFGPGARREDAPPADAGEALWLAYYRSIFNPARVKVAMMKKEMPVRFWKNLPEAAAVPELLAQAPRRQQRMVDDGGAARSRRRGQGQRMNATLPSPAPRSLETLARQAAHCRDCPGADAATQTVFGEGQVGARLMIVGEQPGDHEDLRGKPFQGPAGQLLRGAIAQLGWPSTALYLTNAVKHFHHELRGKRRLHKTPGQREAMACLHWLEDEIEALRPRAIAALGATAVRSLLGADVAITANEGRWLARPDGTPVLVCLHPAAILRADPSRQPAMRERWVACLQLAEMHVIDQVATAGRADQ